MKTFRQIIITSIVQWLPVAVLAVLMCGLIYGAVQQSYRSSANDPQIQMALDARDALARGTPPSQLVPQNTINMAQSLAPYLIIYDTTGTPVASSVSLNGQTPTPPSGVFDSARSLQINKLTWMPQPGVRSAIVVVPYDGGYVLAGRSLTVVEQREDNLVQIVIVACVVSLLVTFVVVLGAQWLASLARPRES
ncbi:MAG TPA: hypothetical protein VF510_00230 [Ktedonobacterales bacterium]